TTSSYASLFILQTNQPAMALGGYQGWDNILTPTQLAGMVADNIVHYFYLPAGGFGSGSFGAAGPTAAVAGGDTDATGALTAWVRDNCSVVSPSVWQGSGDGSGRGGPQLYSCTGAAHR
ncbi:MAG: hypothetical protein ACRDG4_10730, partial [Chloroflexota bacterium]